MNELTVVARLIITRPNTDVGFRSEMPDMSPAQLAIYIYNNYILPGKILSRSQVVSENKLQLTATTVWKSNQERINQSEDPVIKSMFAIHQEHWVNNHIKCEWVNEEIDGDTVVREWRGFFNNP
jgi:hypothetical protein